MKLSRKKIKDNIEERIRKANQKFDRFAGGSKVNFQTNGKIYLFHGTYTLDELRDIIKEAKALQEYLDEEV